MSHDTTNLSLCTSFLHIVGLRIEYFLVLHYCSGAQLPHAKSTVKIDSMLLLFKQFTLDKSSALCVVISAEDVITSLSLNNRPQPLDLAPPLHCSDSEQSWITGQRYTTWMRLTPSGLTNVEKVVIRICHDGEGMTWRPNMIWWRCGGAREGRV